MFFHRECSPSNHEKPPEHRNTFQAKERRTAQERGEERIPRQVELDFSSSLWSFARVPEQRGKAFRSAREIKRSCFSLIFGDDSVRVKAGLRADAGSQCCHQGVNCFFHQSAPLLLLLLLCAVVAAAVVLSCVPRREACCCSPALF